jgi:RIO kinase 1
MNYIDYNKIQRQLRDDEDYYDSGDEGSGQINVNQVKQKKKKKEKTIEEGNGRINTDYELPSRANNKIMTELKNIDKNEAKKDFRNKDKADRATTEQVLDPKTYRVIQKLRNKGTITKLNGCISTGKEANVYHANGPDNTEFAVKIYKTSILVFKDRDRYIGGEFRFRHGYCKGNPRKLIKVWAEKEVRNLKRLQVGNIRCPAPLVLKSNFVMMNFLGKDGNAAPRLKDVSLDSVEEWDKIYIEIIDIMRKLFKNCKLVHADLSEYNILYHDYNVYIIDVAQAVEDDHPNAIYFLKRDCKNINDFFERSGVDPITNQQLFEIITTFENNKNIEDFVNTLRNLNDEKLKENSKFREIENNNFNDFLIPRTLKDEEIDYNKIVKNTDMKSVVEKMVGIHQGDDDSDEEEEEEESDEDSDSEEEEKQNEIVKEEKVNEEGVKAEEEAEKKKKKFDPFQGLSKVERKKKVKEENKEKRKNKKFTKYEKHKLEQKTLHKK